MTALLWIFFLLLFIWIVVLQNKTSDMNNRIDSLSRKLKKLERHIKTPSAENKPALNTQETFEETEYQEESTEDEYIDDTGITENISVTEENTAVKSYSYNYENNEKSEDFEHVFLGKISYIIGAVAIIIGFAIFIGIVQGALSPIAKAIFALMVGMGMIISGLKIKKESLIKYSEALIGTGFAVLFITIYTATMITHTFSYTVCSILGIMALMGAYIIADKQKTVSMIAIALIGGYLNVFIVSHNINTDFLFIYFIFLNILSMAFVLKNSDKYGINFINLVLTFIFTAIPDMMNNPLPIVYPIILWAIYQIYDIIMREKYENYDKKEYFHWLNYAILLLFSLVIFREDTIKIGLVQFYLTIPYCIFSYYFMSKSSPRYRLYLNNLLFCLFPAIFFLLKGCARTGAYSLIAIILSIVTNKLDKDYLAKWATGFISVAIISVFILNKDMFYFYNEANYHPIINMRTLAFLSTILASFICFFEFNTSKSDICKKLSNYMKFCGISLIYVLISFEAGDYIQYLKQDYHSAILISSMTNAIIFSVYSVQMRKLAATTDIKFFKIISYLAGIIVLILLLSAGLKYKPIESFIPVFNIRFIAFMTAIAVTAYIAKSEKTDFYKYLALVLGFLLLSAETNDFTRHIAADDMGYLISVIWILYAGVLLGIGIFKDKKYLKMTGIWIVILTVLKILFVDMAQVNFIYKMIVFVLLGAVLMIVSYYYNKLQK